MGEIIFESPSTRIERFQDNGVDIVRKTVKGKFARLLTSHEVNVLRRLKGVVGVQELIEQDSPTSFTSRYIEGKTLREHE